MTLVLFALLWSGPVAAAAPFTVKDIRVEGLQRIAIGTVFSYLPIAPNDRVDDKRVQDAIRALFATGFFSNVEVRQENGTLVVVVQERPSIAGIEIKGSKKFPVDDLKKRLKDIGLAEGRTFNRSVLEKAGMELQQQYFSEGYYAVKIDQQIKPIDRNRVEIVIDVSEGRVALIEDIRVVGNKAFSDRKVRSRFTLKPKKDVINPFSKKDRYSKQQLQGDLESLRNLYQDAGYLDFEITSTQVALAEDHEYIYITVNIKEGVRYRISGAAVSGDTAVPRADVEKLIDLKPGEVFSRKKVTGIISAINDLLGDAGYAFAKINTVPKKDRAKAEVFVELFVNPGRRVYVRRINVSGNTTTRDDVIRREVRQLEGSWYSVSKLRRSQERLQRLGFFESVELKTPPVPGTNDQVDIDVLVKERATGSVMFGMGYSDANGVFVNLSYNERNAFGSGKSVTVSFDNSQATTTYTLSYLNPYYTSSGVSRGFNVYSSYLDATVTGTGSYNTRTNGAGVTYGIPISEDRRVSVGLAYEGIGLETTSSSSQVAQDFVASYGPNVNILKSTIGWSEDTLNNFIFPTRGGLYRVTAEAGIPGGDVQYYKANLIGSYYFPMENPQSTFRVRGEMGLGGGMGTTTELPFYSNYYAGGAYSVRGFSTRGLGPRDVITDDPIGGNKLVLANTEYYFPVPGSPNDASSMRLSLFMDAGMVYASNQGFDFGQLRYATGIAFNWFTPMFPISLSYGVPLNAQPGDLIENFQFSIGLPLQ